MSCEHRHDEINQLIDGSLDPAARRDLEGHLRTCDACAEMADDLRRVRALAGSLERLEPPRPRGTASRGRPSRRPRGVLLWMTRARRAVMPLATAACLVLAIGLVYLWKRPSPTAAGTADGSRGAGRRGDGRHRRGRAPAGRTALRERHPWPGDAREATAGHRSAGRSDAAEEPAADRPGDRREPRRARARAGERTGATEPVRGFPNQDRVPPGHHRPRQRNAEG